MADVVLYDYWRSSASYRVRIALHLLGLPFQTRPVDLLTGGHRAPSYLALNPQGLVPTLVLDGLVLTQSLAIIEYLHTTQEGSTLVPATALAQAKARQIAFAVAIEIHPICNLSVATYAADISGGGEAAKQDWMRHFIAKGLAGVEGILADTEGPFCLGALPGLADCCLIPQLYNAARWGVDISAHPRLSAVARAAEHHPAFKAAHPDLARPLT